MKLFSIFGLVCLLFLSHLAVSQESVILNSVGNQLTARELVKCEKDNPIPVLISAEIIKETKDDLSFKITNPEVKNELIYNDSRRDALTALPGIVELSILTDEPSFSVTIRKYYAAEYLKTQFDISEVDVSRILNKDDQ